jgi:uncharacterized protein (DUF1330 family)
MSVYLVGQITVKNQHLWKQYVEGVARSLEGVEASILFRGKKLADLSGINERELVVAIEFHDQATLDQWFESELYQSIIPVRDAAADVMITIYEP